MKRLVPVLVDCLREGYDVRKLFNDVMAGILVGIVALPLAIGFAIASGVRPEQGLVTAIIAGASIAVLGGSRVQVSGPTGAFVVVVAGIVDQHGYTGLAVATLMAGGVLVLLGLGGFGSLLKLIPESLVLGFTAGIAIIIFTSQVPYLLGLQIDKLPADFIEKWTVIASNISSVQIGSLICGATAVGVMLLCPLISRKLPAPLTAVLAVTALAGCLPYAVETIGSRFGGLPTSLPEPSLPFSGGFTELWQLFGQLWYPVLAIALLGGIESLLSARVADDELDSPHHRPDAELVGQGIGNMLTPLFGGIPATGAFARTAANIHAGGRTPISAVAHALFLVAILFWMSSWIELVPMAGLAGILAVVAYHMSKWKACLKTIRSSKGEGIQLIATLIATVLVDLMVGLGVGIGLVALRAALRRLT